MAGGPEMPLDLAVAELEALFSGSDDLMLLQTGNTPRSVVPGAEGGGEGGGGGGGGGGGDMGIGRGIFEGGRRVILG